MVLSAVLVAVISVIGFGMTGWIPGRLRFEERLAIGIVVGVLAVSVCSFLAFELIGMGPGTVLCGLAAPGIAAAFAMRRDHRNQRGGSRYAWSRLRLAAKQPASLRPFAALSLASLAVSTRILALSYQTTSKGISAGSLAIWGDWSAHLAYAGSFAYGDNRSLDLPTATGTGFRYHFLADFFGSLFTVGGSTLQQSLAISEWMLAVAFPPLLWLMVMRLTRSRLTAAMTVLLFTLSGGLGAWYFVRDVRNSGWRIVGSLPQTYARMPNEHLWVDNTISASLYAQRSTLLGLSAGLAAMIIVLVSRVRWSRGGFLFAGALIGTLGIAHAHTMLTGLALGSLACIADRRRTWLWFVIPAGAIGLSLAWIIRPHTNSIRWMIGWMAPQSHQSWPWFWFRNVGLLLPLFVGLAVLGGSARRLRRLTAPLWLWFVIPNVVAFHPSEWNNTKYFVFWQLAGCLLIASWLSKAWSSPMSRRPSIRRHGIQLAALSCVLLMIASGGLDTIRAMQRSTSIPWVSRDDVAAASWLRANSRPDDVLVYGANNTSAVAALGGRRAVSGYTGWTYDLGVPDWATRWTDTRVILSGRTGTSEAVDRYGVDFVVIGPIERADYAGSDSYWITNGTLVFESGELRIYRVGA